MREGTFSSRMKTTGKVMLLSCFLVLGLAIPGMAQDQEDPWEQQQTQPADFSDEEINMAANAYVDIIDIREDYQERLANVDDPEKAQDIQMEANERITGAVEDNGLDVSTYNDIITAAQTDEELMDDLLNTIDEIQ